MVLSFSRTRLAHCLSIVAEAGLEGFEYDSATAAYSGQTYRSLKMRWTMMPSPSFSADDFRHYLSIAAIEGMIDAAQHTEEIAVGSYSLDKPVIRLTLKGWIHLEDFDRPILHRWFGNFVQNLPTVIITVIASLIVSWVLYLVEAPK